MSDARTRQVPQPRPEAGRSSLLLRVPSAVAVVLLSVGVLHAHGAEVPDVLPSSRIIPQTAPAPPAVRPLQGLIQVIDEVGPPRLVFPKTAELTKKGSLSGIVREPLVVDPS